MSNSHDILNGKKILIYHINSHVPLRRDNDLIGTTITIINGNGVLNQILKKIKEGEVEVLVTIGIVPETVKLLQVAIDKSHQYIVLIQHELKERETRESFLDDLAARLLQEEGGASYRIEQFSGPILSLNPGEEERSKFQVD